MEQFLSSISLELFEKGFSEEQIANIIQIIELQSYNYNISKKETELIIYEESKNIHLMKLFGATKTLEGKSEKTIKAYLQELKKFLNFYGKDLTEVTSNDIKIYLALMQKRGCKNSTVENSRAYLSSFFSWMLEESYIEKNPSASIKPIKIKKEIKLPFSAVEIDKLRTNCKNEKERALIEFLLSTGARINEVVEMNIEDIDFDTLKVHIKNGKGDKERLIMMSSVAALHLKNYLDTRTDTNPALFVTQRDKIRMGADGARYLLRTIAEKAKLTNVHPHRFRRTFATTLSHRGMDISQIQKLLGHSNLDTTMKYVYVDDENTINTYKKYM